MNFSWMAWTWPTAIFFAGIVLALVGMGLWERLSPGGAPRRGIFRIVTHRGDRLFLSLLGSAFIHLGWIGLASGPLWWASLISLVYAVGVFCFV
jgi:predicted small integral membrane protein